MEGILPLYFFASCLVQMDMILVFFPVPYRQTWIHQPDLNACMCQKTVKPLLNFIDAKAIQTADLTEILLPGRLLKTFQAAILQVIDDSQIYADGRLPVVKRCPRDVIKQGLGYLRIRHFNDKAKIDI